MIDAQNKMKEAAEAYGGVLAMLGPNGLISHKSVLKVALQKSISTQIRELILYIGNSK